MKHMGIIPARLSSQRLKDKPLQLVNGVPLCLLVAENLIKTKVFDHVIVATDSKKVADLFEDHEAQAVMTDPDHQSGTDRIHEVVSKLNVTDGIVFNIQGDEPFIYKDDLVSLQKVMEAGADMATLYEDLESSEIDNPNKVKVLVNNRGEAIYFSRFGVPFSRLKADQTEKGINSSFVGKHIGLYAYSVKFLNQFCKYGEGYFESFEKLEQLRALEMGFKINVIKTENAYQGVDTLEDLEKVNKLLKSMEN
jgi:3-deoxy-manno-octulosonate cytidylyltransferase (CMP-KDO synthetase)